MNGTLSDQDLKDILSNAQELVGTINPSFNDTRGLNATLTPSPQGVGLNGHQGWA